MDAGIDTPEGYLGRTVRSCRVLVAGIPTRDGLAKKVGIPYERVRSLEEGRLSEVTKNEALRIARGLSLSEAGAEEMRFLIELCDQKFGSGLSLLGPDLNSVTRLPAPTAPVGRHRALWIE